MGHAPKRRFSCAKLVESLEQRVFLTVGEVVRQGAFEGTSANVAVDWIKGSAWQAGQLGFTNYHGGTGYAYNGTASGGYVHNTSGAAGEMYQELTIPAGTANPTLEFWTKVSTEETSTTTKFDTMAVQVRNTAGTVLSTLVTLSNLDGLGVSGGPHTASGKYTLRSYNLGAYTGQTIRIYFKVTTDGSRGTMFRVDDVSLAPPSPVVPGTSKQVVAYLPDYRYSLLSQMDLNLLTHINYFSVGFQSSGVLNAPSATFNAHLDTVVAAAHAKGVGVSITTGPSQPYSAMASTATGRHKFAEELKLYVLAHNLDGVDIDWEPPAKGFDQVNYGLLIDELYATFNPIGKKITAAVNPWTKEIPVDASKKMNWINVMCYDFDYANHSTYAAATDGMLQWTYYGVAKDKLVMGVPFYGRKGTSWSNTSSITYNTWVNNYVAANGTYPPVTLDTWNSYFLNGVRTMQMKMAFVRDSGYAGTFTWELGQDFWNSSAKHDKYSLAPIMHSMTRPPAWLTTTTGSLHDLVNNHFIASLGTMTFNADTVGANPKLDLLINNGATVVLGATNHVGSLAIDAGGFLDIQDKKLVIDWTGSSPIGSWNGSAYTGVLGLARSGAIKTTMGGSDIVIGVAEASSVITGLGASQTTVWQGTTIDGSSVLVRRTYNGDTNLDGRLDGDDFFNIDAHYGQAGAVCWNYGDFNTDGRIDADDYFILSSAYMHNQGTLSASMVSTDSTAAGQLAEASTAGAELPTFTLFSDRTRIEDERNDVLTEL